MSVLITENAEAPAEVRERQKIHFCLTSLFELKMLFKKKRNINVSFKY